MVDDTSGNLTSWSTDGATTSTAAYDLADRRTSLTPPGSPPTTTSFSYDALGRARTRTTGSLAETMSYLGVTETVLRVDPSTGSDRDGLTGPAGGRLATRTGSTLRHLLVDPHGNLTAAEGAGATTIVEAIRTDAYGVELDTYPTTPFGLADVGYGGRFDLAPAGADPLYDFSARDYVPGLGAFASLDTYQGSTTEPRSLHRFAYAWGNPATMIDPTGHAGCPGGRLAYDGQVCQGQSTDGLNPDEGGPMPVWEAPKPKPAEEEEVSDPRDAGTVPPPEDPTEPAPPVDPWLCGVTSISNAVGPWVPGHGCGFTDDDRLEILRVQSEFGIGVAKGAGTGLVAVVLCSSGVGCALVIGASATAITATVATHGLEALVPSSPEQWGMVAGGLIVVPLAGTSSSVSAASSGLRASAPRTAADLIRGGRVVGAATQRDPYHLAPAFVIDDMAERGNVFNIVGNDGLEYLLVQLPGEVNGIVGRFELVVGAYGDITHMLFVPRGTINGVPIKP